MGRRPCCWKVGLRKGAWSSSEDSILTNYINTHGAANWRDLPQKAGLERCGKSCRLRWLNYLKPDIKRGSISPEEEDLILRMHNLLGNRWSLIAGRLPGRTDNEIKNHWNCKLRKRVKNDDDDDKKINDDFDDENHNNKVVWTRAVRLTRPININITQPDHNLQNDHQNYLQKQMMVDQDDQKCIASSRDNIQDYVVNNDDYSIEAAAMVENWISSWEQNDDEDPLIGSMGFNVMELDTFLNYEYDKHFSMHDIFK